MLIRRNHRLQALRIRRCMPDDFEPSVIVGPVFLLQPSIHDRYAFWRDEEKLPRRRINGRWLPARRASHVQWVSIIAHRGSRREDRRTSMLRKAAERCCLYRYTSIPF